MASILGHAHPPWVEALLSHAIVKNVLAATHVPLSKEAGARCSVAYT